MSQVRRELKVNLRTLLVFPVVRLGPSSIGSRPSVFRRFPAAVFFLSRACVTQRQQRPNGCFGSQCIQAQWRTRSRRPGAQIAMAAVTLSLLVAVVAAAAAARTATAAVPPFRLHVLQKLAASNGGNEAPDPQNLYELCAVDGREALETQDFDGVCGGVDKVTLALGLEGDTRANLHFDLLYSSLNPFQVVLLGECTAAAAAADQQTVTVLFDVTADQVLRVSSPGGLSGCATSYVRECRTARIYSAARPL